MTPTRLTLVVAAGVVIAGGMVWGTQQLLKRADPVERALAQTKALPLVGLVMADHPDVEAKLRETIREDQKHPIPGQSRAFAAITEIRKNYVAPALRAADDASATTVLAKRVELARHLQQVNVAVCREFANEGIRDVNGLDTESQRLFREMLQAMEAAYRSGKSAGNVTRPVPTQQEFGAMMREGGFTQADFDKLGQAASLSDSDICKLETRIDDTPTQLAEDKRGPFARFVLAH